MRTLGLRLPWLSAHSPQRTSVLEKTSEGQSDSLPMPRWYTGQKALLLTWAQMAALMVWRDKDSSPNGVKGQDWKTRTLQGV